MVDAFKRQLILPMKIKGKLGSYGGPRVPRGDGDGLNWFSKNISFKMKEKDTESLQLDILFS